MGEDQAARECDFIVVGGGTAGCAAAARLSGSGRTQVVLLEAGGKDRSFWIRAPLGYGILYNNPNFNWIYESEGEPALSNARAAVPRGRVLGGTSSTNGMVYMRGQRQDFDQWRQLGNVGWGYDDVRPFFKKAEANQRGGDEFHGQSGPLAVSNMPRHELADAFIAAAQLAGYKRNDDFNGARQEGFGYNQLTLRAARRCNTAEAYLKPARGRRNLQVILHALTTRILFTDGNATGVAFRRQDGTEETLIARRGVILAAGAFNSPQLLQLSGIGPAALLQSCGVPVVKDLPGVGENLQDHFTASANYRCAKPVTVNDIYNNPLRRLAVGLNYILFRKGPMATGANFGGGFIRTDESLQAPDVAFTLALWSRAAFGRSKARLGLHPFSSFSVAMSLLHPDNRGTVRIKSSDSAVAPEIRFNLYTSERDRRTSIKAVRALRKSWQGRR